MLALSKLTHINREKVDAAKLPIKGFALFVAGALLFLVTLNPTDIGPRLESEFDRETIRYTIQGVALAPLLYYPIVYHKHLFFRILENPVLKKIGVFSYAIYLVHFPLHEGLVEHIDVLANSAPLATVVTLLISCAIAWGIDVAIDSPLKKYRASLR